MEDFNFLKEHDTINLSQIDRQLLINAANSNSNRQQYTQCCCNTSNDAILEELCNINGTLADQHELLVKMYQSITAVNPTVIFAEYPEVTDQGLIYHWDGGIINQSVNLMSIVFKGTLDTENIPVFVTDRYNTPFPVLAVGSTKQLMSDDLKLSVLFPVTYDNVNLQLYKK